MLLRVYQASETSAASPTPTIIKSYYPYCSYNPDRHLAICHPDFENDSVIFIVSDKFMAAAKHWKEILFLGDRGSPTVTVDQAATTLPTTKIQLSPDMDPRALLKAVEIILNMIHHEDIAKYSYIHFQEPEVLGYVAFWSHFFGLEDDDEGQLRYQMRWWCQNAMRGYHNMGFGHNEVERKWEDMEPSQYIWFLYVGIIYRDSALFNKAATSICTRFDHQYSTSALPRAMHDVVDPVLRTIDATRHELLSALSRGLEDAYNISFNCSVAHEALQAALLDEDLSLADYPTVIQGSIFDASARITRVHHQVCRAAPEICGDDKPIDLKTMIHRATADIKVPEMPVFVSRTVGYGLMAT